jgi:glucosamine--fructose-6-phosphate aminotransferase (isomerizing)
MSTNHLLNEILEQPSVLRRIHDEYVTKRHDALSRAADLLKRADPIIITGMVTSEFSALQAADLLRQAGRTVIVSDASEFLHYRSDKLPETACVVAVSQSGESAEIVKLLEKLDHSVPIVGVYNYEDSYLAEHCDVGLPIYAGRQRACGSKTNLATIAVMLLLASATIGEGLESTGEKLLAVARSIDRFLENWEGEVAPVADFLEGSTYTVFMGRGPGVASALFTAVLFKEVPKLVVEGMNAAAFRHGLLEMIRPEHRVVIFAQEGRTHDLCLRLVDDVISLDVPVVLITNSDDEVADGDKLCVLRTEHHDELWAPILDMVPLQLVGYVLAKRRGLDPGVLQIATYVTTVE